MRIDEVATQVKIVDGSGRSFYYWVTLTRPEKIKAAAIKKHKSTMGLISDADLTATIMPKLAA